QAGRCHPRPPAARRRGGQDPGEVPGVPGAPGAPEVKKSQGKDFAVHPCVLSKSLRDMGQRPTVLKSCAVATKNEQTGAQAPPLRPGALADRFTVKMKRTALLGGPFF